MNRGVKPEIDLSQIPICTPVMSQEQYSQLYVGMTFYKFLEFAFYWLFVISNILASFIVGGILYYVYKYYRHYVDSDRKKYPKILKFCEF